MKVFITLCVLFIGAYCVPLLDKQLGNEWALFKRVHQKQYKTNEEESARYVIREFFNLEMIFLFYFIASRKIWEANNAKIRQHNLEADLGIHTYTLGMNRFGDLVAFFTIIIHANIL
jgi:hypothetical protein